MRRGVRLLRLPTLLVKPNSKFAFPVPQDCWGYQPTSWLRHSHRVQRGPRWKNTVSHVLNLHSASLSRAVTSTTAREASQRIGLGVVCIKDAPRTVVMHVYEYSWCIMGVHAAV